MEIRKRLAAAFAFALFSLCASAVPVSLVQAEKAVGNWLARGYGLDKAMSRTVASSKTYATANGESFHVVSLEGGGFVVTSGDTTVEPVVAYSAGANLAEDERSPLLDLIRRDLSRRAKTPVRAKLKSANGASAGARSEKTPEERWEELTSPAALRGAMSPKDGVGDVRVAPLVKSRWGQGKNSMYSNRGEKCYNYYTPNNSVCGCVATAMAQLMRYHCFPTASVTPQTRTCTVNGEARDLKMKGGVYDWDKMKLVPEASSSPAWYDGGATEEVREAIGKLTYDCGVAMCMNYTLENSGSTGSFAHDPLLRVFGYANAVGYFTSEEISVDVQKQIIYPNLDAGYPVMLAVYGHEILADGYGYSDEVLFTHLNMGWCDGNDVWYNLPDIVCDNGYSSTYVDGITYNVFPDKTGDIFSGRVTDASGNPVKGAVVSVRLASGGDELASMTTGENGIYAFVLEGNKTYVATANSGGGSGSCESAFLPKSVNCRSVNVETRSYDPTGMQYGNSWGNDIQLNGLASVATPVLDPAGGLFYPTAEVRISCATEGATIRYTLDGSNPTEESDAYTGLILIEDDTTLKARAFKSGMNPSVTVVAEYVYDAAQGAPKGDYFANPIKISGAEGSRKIAQMEKYGVEANEPDHTLLNGYHSTHYCSAWYEWTAPGSGTMSFSTRCTGYYRYPNAVAVYVGESITDVSRIAMAKNYADNDYASSLTVDVEQGKTYRIAGVVTYSLAGDEDVDFTLTWSGDLTVAAEETPVTDEVPIAVKYNWLQQYYPSLETSGYADKVKAQGANGRPVWQSYLLGLDPTNEDSDFRITSFEMKDGLPVVNWNVDPERVKGFGYELKLKGKVDLKDAVWTDQKDGQRYFRAFVEPK